MNTISASLSVAEPAAPAKHTFRAADGFEIAYWVDDFTDPWIEPETLLLLHAAMGSSRRWFRWVPRLARRFRVVRMDLRGHGHSQKPRPEEPFSLDQLVGDAARLIDILGCGGAHVVGNSAGGYVAQQLAIRQPEKVKTLALYGARDTARNNAVVLREVLEERRCAGKRTKKESN